MTEKEYMGIMDYGEVTALSIPMSDSRNHTKCGGRLQDPASAHLGIHNFL